MHSRYKSDESSTYKKNGSNFESGNLVGFVSQDVFQIGDLKIKNQDFVEVSSRPDLSLASDRFDGILGLGHDIISVNKIVPPFYNMIDQKLIDESVFSFYLSDTNKKGDESEVCFGGINKDHYSGNLEKIPLRRKAYWELTLIALVLVMK